MGACVYQRSVYVARMNPRHQHSELIDRLGTNIVREAFALSPQTLHMWRRRGVPALKRIAFAKLAADNGVPVPPDFFEKFEARA